LLARCLRPGLLAHCPPGNERPGSRTASMRSVMGCRSPMTN
jgi:hypothetical protein